jgi:hypothetical protein
MSDKTTFPFHHPVLLQPNHIPHLGSKEGEIKAPFKGRPEAPNHMEAAQFPSASDQGILPRFM